MHTSVILLFGFLNYKVKDSVMKNSS